MTDFAPRDKFDYFAAIDEFRAVLAGEWLRLALNELDRHFVDRPASAFIPLAEGRAPPAESFPSLAPTAGGAALIHDSGVSASPRPRSSNHRGSR